MDFELMLAMGWSWRELDETPAYVKRYSWDLLQARRAAEAAANERSIQDAKAHREGM